MLSTFLLSNVKVLTCKIARKNCHLFWATSFSSCFGWCLSFLSWSCHSNTEYSCIICASRTPL